jgi:hypothetical protein
MRTTDVVHFCLWSPLLIAQTQTQTRMDTQRLLRYQAGIYWTGEVGLIRHDEMEYAAAYRHALSILSKPPILP